VLCIDMALGIGVNSSLTHLAIRTDEKVWSNDMKSNLQLHARNIHIHSPLPNHTLQTPPNPHLMPHPSSNPIHPTRVPLARENTPILVFTTVQPRNLLSQLLSSPFLLAAPLPLGAIVQQECQRTAERQDSQALEDIAIDVCGVVIVVVLSGVIVVRLVVVPICKFGFEEGGEPFSEGGGFFWC
jgi:hypothetical protein